MTPIESEAIYLCDLAIKFGFLSEASAKECLNMQAEGIKKNKPRRIGRFLLEYGFIEENQYAALIKKYITFKKLEGIREEIIAEADE